MKGIHIATTRGMSLVEVMVAVLVLGIGVMGYAALQVRSVRMSEDTYSRSQAMAIAQDAVERVRSNLNALGDYYGASWGGAPTAPASSCIYTGSAPVACTPTQLAAEDVYQLKTIARSMLPTGSISVQSCAQLACVIVAWNETVAATSTGADTAECKQTDVDGTDRGNAGHCVIVQFIP